ncbi:MAG: AI-2E family transporter [Lachnospiraceae bacterium]
MKFKWDKKYLHWGITALLVILTSIFFIYTIFNGAHFKSSISKIISISIPITNGLVIAYLLSPIVNYFECKIKTIFKKKIKTEESPKTKNRIRALSIAMTFLLVGYFIFGFFMIVLPQLYLSIESIVNLLPTYVTNLNNVLNKLVEQYPELADLVSNAIPQYSQEFMAWVNGTLLPGVNNIILTLSLSVLSFLKTIWNLIIGLIISVYVLISKEKFIAQAKKIAYSFLDREAANQLILDVQFTNKTFGGFINGKLLDSLIIGIICFVCTSFIGTPYPILVSVIIGVTNIVPFFGPYLGAIPCSLLILLIDPIQCFYFIIFILILQQFDGNILGPKILGDSTGLSGFWVIFSITIFGGIFGILGMIIGVPLFAVIYALFSRRVRKNLYKKGLPDDTASYMDMDEITDTNHFINNNGTRSNNNFYKEIPEDSRIINKIKESIYSNSDTGFESNLEQNFENTDKNDKTN